MPLLLTEADVRRVLPLADLIPCMETTLEEFSTGGVEQPLRSVLDVGTEPVWVGVMPASIRASQAAGLKIVSVAHRNPARGLPSHLATILLLHPDTGAVEAVLDGRYITEARTAAVSAVAARHLAAAGASRLGIIGSGLQARSHLRAMALVRPLERVRVWSPTRAHREAFQAEMQPECTAPIEAVDGPARAVAGADLIVVATSSTRPVLHRAWVSPGAHVTAIGAYRPDHQELDPGLVAAARVFVDSRSGALAEAGDLVLPIREGRITPSHIAGEIGEVIAGRAAGRLDPSDLTLFKSLGMAAEDVAAAALACRRASEAGIGRRADL